MMFKLLTGLCLAAALSGCVATQESCGALDWRAAGFSDGSDFELPSRRTQLLIDGCPQYGVYFDQGAYDAGVSEGLRNFCARDMRAVGYAHAGAERLFEGPRIAQSCARVGMGFDAFSYEDGYQTRLAGDCDRDWEGMGYRDGRDGDNPRDIDRTRAFCAQGGYGALVDRYSFGYEEGLDEFCEIRRARRLGRRGEPPLDWSACGFSRRVRLERAYDEARERAEADVEGEGDGRRRRRR